jgi:hypothetical protein
MREKSDGLCSLFVREASQKVLIEQFDAIIDDLHLDFLRSALLRITRHVFLQAKIQQLHSLPFDKEPYPFTLALH